VSVFTTPYMTSRTMFRNKVPLLSIPVPKTSAMMFRATVVCQVKHFQVRVPQYTSFFNHFNERSAFYWTMAIIRFSGDVVGGVSAGWILKNYSLSLWMNVRIHSIYRLSKIGVDRNDKFPTQNRLRQCKCWEGVCACMPEGVYKLA
jgi:hypothetical protein